RAVGVAPELARIPAVRVEIGRHAAFAGRHAANGAGETMLGSRQMGQQTLNGPAFVAAPALPVIGAHAVEGFQKLALCRLQLVAQRGLAVLHSAEASARLPAPATASAGAAPPRPN